jgi:hypothetical protein
MKLCMYVCMYVCMCVLGYERTYVLSIVCTYDRMAYGPRSPSGDVGFGRSTHFWLTGPAKGFVVPLSAVAVTPSDLVFVTMTDKPDLFQFLSDVRQGRPMILVPIDQARNETGPPEVVVPTSGGPDPE